RDMQRTSWTQDLIGRLRARGLGGDFAAGQTHYFGHEAPGHPSAIVRAFAGHPTPLERPADVFIACYLLTQPEAAGTEPPSGAIEFSESLAREEEKQRSEGGEADAT